MNNIKDFIKEARETAPLQCEVTTKDTFCEPGSDPSSDTESTTLILDFPASEL